MMKRKLLSRVARRYQSQQSDEDKEFSKRQLDAYHRIRERKAAAHNEYAMSSVSYTHGKVSQEGLQSYDHEALKENIYDYIVIGSGYGGSIYAMRMAEKGYSVVLLEQGRRWNNIKTNVDLNCSDLWKPNLLKLLRGKKQYISLGDICVETNVGVGGCSLEQSSHLEEHPDFKDLEPYYKKVRQFLGVSTQPAIYERDGRVVTAASNVEVPFEAYRTDVGIFFGKQAGNIKDQTLLTNEERRIKDIANNPNRTVKSNVDDESHNTRRQQLQRDSLGMKDMNISERGRAVWDDPYFEGLGMTRSPCMECGECSVGCSRNAKNSLDKNYLYLAEMRYGVNILNSYRATAVRYLGEVEDEEDDSRYVVDGKLTIVKPNEDGLSDVSVGKSIDVRLKARNVVVSCGTVETNSLLLQMKKDELGLPNLPDSVGTNIFSPTTTKLYCTSLDLEGTPDGRDFSEGVSASVVLKTTDNNGKIEVSGVPLENSRTRYTSFRRQEHYSGLFNVLKQCLINWYNNPIEMYHWCVKPGWNETTLVLKEVIPNDEPMTMSINKKQPVLSCETPHNIPRHSGKVADELLESLGGGFVSQNYKEVLFNKSVVSDIVGGVDSNTINSSTNEVHSYPGLYVVDGSTINQSLGSIDSTLTVAAIAERAADSVPVSTSGKAKPRFSEYTPWTTVEFKDRGHKVN